MSVVVVTLTDAPGCGGSDVLLSADVCVSVSLFQLFWSAQMKDELSSQILSGPLQEHRKVLKGVSSSSLTLSRPP